MGPVDARITSILEQIYAKTRREAPLADNLLSIQQEIRSRRKFLLGSNISVRMLVRSRGVMGIDGQAVEALSHYLASRAAFFWRPQKDGVETFLFRFYRLALTGIGSGRVGQECIDDVLQLSNALVRSRKVFSIAMEDLLPPGMLEELRDFVENTDNDFFNYATEDAVLGGICVLLGTLSDPLSTSNAEEGEA